MSSRTCFNVLKIVVIVSAILDLLVNIYNIISAYIHRRDGVYNRYEWQWNGFFISRIVVASIILVSVVRSKPVWLIISTLLNIAIFVLLVCAVVVAKLAYYNCELELCRNYQASCSICYSRNYNDYHLTSVWSGELSCDNYWLPTKINCHDCFSFTCNQNCRSHRLHSDVTEEVAEAKLRDANHRMKAAHFHITESFKSTHLPFKFKFSKMHQMLSS